MEGGIVQVRLILDRLTAAAGRPPGHGSFWRGSRDDFVKGPVYGQTPIIIPGNPDGSFLVKILKGPATTDPPGNMSVARMPLGGPYISDSDLEFIRQWIKDGAKDADHSFRAELSKLP
jgi:hypothetical protein